MQRSEAEIAARVKALESIMIEKGIMTTERVDRLVEIYENEVGPQLGAAVVAKAWTDPEFKARLLANGTEACAELGIGGLQGEDMVVVENTDTVHNVITCTLCSCYPWPVLGLPPNWYKGPAYRSRIVREPRKVLRETSGSTCPTPPRCASGTRRRRCATGCCRSVPRAPRDLDEKALAALVTRDSMIGTGTVEAAR